MLISTRSSFKLNQMSLPIRVTNADIGVEEEIAIVCVPVYSRPFITG